MGRAQKALGRILPVFAVFALLAGLANAEFSMKSLSVFVNINLDGSANIEERLDIVINGTSSRELYEITRSVYSDLTSWRERTKLSEMRHHVTRAKAEIVDLRIIPQAIERCNSFIGICHATVLINYKVEANQNGSGLVKVERYKPRTIRYSLQQDALSFEQTKTGDLILPADTVISISIPQNSEKIFFSTVPTNLKDEPEESFRYDSSSNSRHYIGSKRTFTWSGNVLSKFQFIYEVELPLETEVVEFFVGNQKKVSELLFGPQGPAAIFIMLISSLSFYYINRLEAKR